MPDVDEAVRNQVRNIEASTGRSIDEWVGLVGSNGDLDEEVIGWLREAYARA
jgi:uncharacterized protein DUF4287